MLWERLAQAAMHTEHLWLRARLLEWSVLNLVTERKGRIAAQIPGFLRHAFEVHSPRPLICQDWIPRSEWLLRLAKFQKPQITAQ